jgi:hypothetical protein
VETEYATTRPEANRNNNVSHDDDNIFIVICIRSSSFSFGSAEVILHDDDSDNAVRATTVCSIYVYQLYQQDVEYNYNYYW